MRYINLRLTYLLTYLECLNFTYRPTYYAFWRQDVTCQRHVI